MTEKDNHNEEEELRADEMADQQTGDNVADNASAEDGEGEIPVENAEEKDPLDIALAKIEEVTTKYKYLAAEFDNYRKRTLKERAELILNGGEKAIVALLPVVDDMERALKNGEKTDDPVVLREGMELIYQKMMKTLESLGVKRIETEGADFDTDLHDAEALVPGMGDDKKGKVIDCLATGYKLNDKVIRHAKVAVGQ
ncbi:MAG: nucleotide exchange factor GrpE [Prevotella sp.]|jgi:molecular chaperone GrpE|nr:nucleotide exchange factor GrpE [Prevotella sp.]